MSFLRPPKMPAMPPPPLLQQPSPRTQELEESVRQQEATLEEQRIKMEEDIKAREQQAEADRQKQQTALAARSASRRRSRRALLGNRKSAEVGLPTIETPLGVGRKPRRAGTRVY